MDGDPHQSTVCARPLKTRYDSFTFISCNSLSI